MYIALGIVAAIVLVIVVVVVVGKLLPVAHIARVRATFARPGDEVWAALADFASYPAWRRNLARAEPVDADRKIWKEVSPKGEAMTYETLEIDPGNRLVRRIADRDLPFGGKWVFELRRDAPASTTVSILEEGEVYNPVFRFVSKFIMGHHATMQGFLVDLGKKLGEQPNISKE
jgi:uncharacterized protein YndB with AHSA1/START domain